MDWSGIELGPRRREADWYYPQPWFSHVIVNKGGVLLDVIACDVVTRLEQMKEGQTDNEIIREGTVTEAKKRRSKRNIEEKNRMDERKVGNTVCI